MAAVILVEGITDRIALEAVAERLGLELDGIEIVPIGGAQAVSRAAAEYDGVRLVGLCDVGEERYFRRALGNSVFVCAADLEDELLRALGPERVEVVLAAQGDLETFRAETPGVYRRHWTVEEVGRQIKAIRHTSAPVIFPPVPSGIGSTT